MKIDEKYASEAINDFANLRCAFKNEIENHKMQEDMIDLELTLDNIFNQSFICKEKFDNHMHSITAKDEIEKITNDEWKKFINNEHKQTIKSFKNLFKQEILRRIVKCNQFDFLTEKSEKARNKIFNYIFNYAYKFGSDRHDATLHPFLSVGYTLDNLLRFIDRNRNLF